MQLKHADIWRALDRLAERHGLSPSGLAIKAGLSPTAFNPSKRVTRNRNRWPSTESIAQVLQATDTSLEDFVLLASVEPVTISLRTLPVITLSQAGRKGSFDDKGYPAGKDWDEINFPGLSDDRAFMIEVTGKSAEPLYRDGDRVVVAPGEKPRRGDRVVARTRKGEILIREYARENAKGIELASFHHNDETTTLALADIEWVYRILWVSQ